MCAGHTVDTCCTQPITHHHALQQNHKHIDQLRFCVQAMELIHDAGNPSNLVVHLDTYHMNIEESSSEHAVGICGDKLG